MKKLLMTVVCVILVGCAGTSFGWSSARQVKSGMTTQEVTKIMGAPYSVTSTGGKMIYVWSSANGFTGSVKTLAVVFVDGKVITAPTVPEEYK